MIGSIDNTIEELNSFIEVGETRRIEQAGLVALLTAQERNALDAQNTLHEIEDALAALRVRRAQLWTIGEQAAPVKG